MRIGIGRSHPHRGVIGIESALVLIAFVIVAASLAFVVLNMGFGASQEAKSAIVSGLGQTSSTVELSGKVTGIGDVSDNVLNVTAFPIKIATGGDSLDLDETRTSLKYFSNTVEYDDVLAATLVADVYPNLTQAFQEAINDLTIPEFNLGENPVTEDVPANTAALIYWTVRSNNNDILERGEHAVIAIAYSLADRPAPFDKIRIELLTSEGTTLTVVREIPQIPNVVIDMG